MVDRLWPRGLSKKRAHLDLWLKELAPSTELRKWFNHDPERWTVFQRKYMLELIKNPEIVAVLEKILKTHKRVTLLYAAKDEEHNEAIVIKDFVNQ